MSKNIRSNQFRNQNQQQHFLLLLVKRKSTGISVNASSYSEKMMTKLRFYGNLKSEAIIVEEGTQIYVRTNCHQKLWNNNGDNRTVKKYRLRTVRSTIKSG